MFTTHCSSVSAATDSARRGTQSRSVELALRLSNGKEQTWGIGWHSAAKGINAAASCSAAQQKIQVLVIGVAPMSVFAQSR